MNDLGWVKIHRKITDWEWYTEPNTFRLFVHLILKANHKERKYRGVLVKKGTHITSQELLAIETGLSRQQVRTALNNLEATNEITIKSSRQGTIIQVLTYSDYQEATNDLTNEQPTSNQRATSNKNDKKEKNVSKTNKFEEFWNEYPQKKGKARALKLYQKLLKDYSEDQLIDSAKNYSKEMELENRERKYIKSGDNFLKDEFFVDYLPDNYGEKESNNELSEEKQRQLEEILSRR